ncbi:hypothetical protein [Prevotellamassilia timonensis]|uniref:hypothetical protein n=1 Tax=Prevotellamassilia timonensis TaxID=1852370 RepID=UPI003FD894CD
MKKKHYERPHSQGVFLHTEGLIATSGGNGTTSLPIKPNENVDDSEKSPSQLFGTTGWGNEE